MKGYKSLRQDLRIIKNYSWLALFVLITLLLLFGVYCGIRYLRFIKPATESFPLTLTWKIDLGISNYDRPYYQNGMVFMPTYNHWHGVEAENGQITWSQTAFRNSFMRCLTPDYMIISGPSSLLALDPDTGKSVWEGNVGTAASCSDTIVFVIGTRGFIYAADLATGEWLWGGITPRQYNTYPGLIYNSYTNDLIVGNRHKVDPVSGHIRHSSESVPALIPRDGERGPTYLINNDQLLIGGTVRDIETGKILHLEQRLNGYAAPTVTEDTIYIADGVVGEDRPKGVTALNRDSFEIKWQYTPYDESSGDILVTMSPVAIFDEMGYVIFSDATLRAFDLETGQEIGYWQPQEADLFYWSICTLAPFLGCVGPSGYGMAASEDTLFVSFGDGKLYAFGK